MKLTKLLGAAAVAATFGFAAQADDPTTVGFVYVGPVGDGGWTFQHNEGRLALEAEFGDSVQTIVQESVAAGPDAERVMTQMALAGADIIFTTSFGYMDGTNTVAARFPDVKFEHATGYKREHSNVSTYNARFYEGRAIQGHLAGRLTETNKIGYIASYPIPEVFMGINSAFLHAQKVNPDVEMVVIWAYTWFDPAKEADAAKAMIEQGVDVILQHTDSTAPHSAALEANANGSRVFTFGQASDMTAFAQTDDGGPGPRISAIINDWSPYYIRRVQELKDGTYEQTANWGGMPSGEVVIGEMNAAVPDDIKAEAMGMIEAIKAGEYHPFTGPIMKQDGTVFLEEGETATDQQLVSMNFYLQGMTGEIPN